jgi:hypothetical protein
MMPNDFEEAKPIPPTPTKNGLPCPDKVSVPAMPGVRLGWTDYLLMGSRRALKTALYTGGAAVAICGIGTMFGLAFLPAIKGAALIVGGGALAAGAGKMEEEKQKQEGKQPAMERIICAIITAIVAAIVAMKKKGGAK